ncbi:ergothioneine biosynthesis glutamate--cysteine ligase EgtA [Kibdelosporangium phytohabitans]|uniref:Glutamate--cysteine ligase EgtA n=1 Tax=Kibdelosporangium phytohabitans TaxID=860235 RepID=A0A0N7F3K6_9PSEU|nr:ergothioneine biosynthesis glutamate--cysteine ligase EgtA [Kibdelosporangium phytohabitans]ALG08895.1 glutamate--cysteine ligase [Kibdelosporangium phytohabitans]MBE1469951.1 glutamate--cysteine ligase [Kibdelosporangium phytohabitans]
MTILRDTPIDGPEFRPLRERVEAEAYVASVCFKHGPPRLTGVELEWTVHHAGDPARRLSAELLRQALGDHAPRTLNPDSPQISLPGGSPLTAEPGGQVEISAQPEDSLTDLHATVSADTEYLAGLLAARGLTMGESAMDPYRTPARVLETPRYLAMEKAFEPLGSHGITMMCNTAGFQVCVDAGERQDLAVRWRAAHVLGPPLSALFANSPQMLGRRTGWVSNRLHTVLGTDPVRTYPSETTDDPATSWARRVLDTPLLCVRRDGGCWDAPSGVTFADWVAGAVDLGRQPTVADLEYHISTLFPPVRAQGYLEIRYIDAQPGGDWLAPAALVVALFSEADKVIDICEPVANDWLTAARAGLGDPALARVAASLAELGTSALGATGLTPELARRVTGDIDRRLHDGRNQG